MRIHLQAHADSDRQVSTSTAHPPTPTVLPPGHGSPAAPLHSGCTPALPAWMGLAAAPLPPLEPQQPSGRIWVTCWASLPLVLSGSGPAACLCGDGVCVSTRCAQEQVHAHVPTRLAYRTRSTRASARGLGRGHDSWDLICTTIATRHTHTHTNARVSATVTGSLPPPTHTPRIPQHSRLEPPQTDLDP